MQPEESRVGDPDERIIDLEVEESADPARSHFLEAARGAVGPGRCQGHEDPAMAVRRERNMVLRRQQDLPGFQVNGRHLPLREEADVFQAKLIVGPEELDGGLVVLGAGHDVERDDMPVTTSQGDDLLGVDLEQACRGDRPDRKGPFGPLESQASPGSAGHEDHTHLARGDRVGPDPGRPTLGDAFAVGLG